VPILKAGFLILVKSVLDAILYSPTPGTGFFKEYLLAFYLIDSFIIKAIVLLLFPNIDGIL